MPEHYDTRRGKLLPRHTRAIMRLAQDMHNPNATMPHYDFAFDRQFQPYLFVLNVALHSHHRRNGLQFVENRKHREITGMNDQFNARELLPDSFRQPLEVRDMGI